MAKVKNEFDPRIEYKNLSQEAQRTISRFLYLWASAMTSAERTALLGRYPKAARWCAGQWTRRPEDPQFKKFMERAADMTPVERKRLGLPEELGPRFAPKETAEAARSRYRTAANIAAEEYDRAFSGKGKLPKETPEQARARYRITAQIAAEEYAKAFAERKVPRETPEALRARVRESARITAEEYAKAFAERRVRETPGQLRARVRESARITAEEYERAFRVSRERGRGTPNEQRALARLRSSGYASSVAVRIYDEGLWERMERLDPGCTDRVFNKWVQEETSKWTGRLQRGKKPWELTAGDVAESKLSLVQLSYVAAASRPIRDQLANLGIQVERPMPVSDYLKSIAQLHRLGRGRKDVFWLTVPGPVPMRVPVPIVSGWTPAGGVPPQGMRARLGAPYLPLRERQRRLREARLLPAGAVFGGAGAAVKPPAKVPTAKAIGAALPDIIGLAIQTGALPAESGLAQAYGAYALQVGAKSALMKMGVGAAVAGPLSVVIGLAGLFGGLRRGRRARAEYRRKREELRAAGAARALTYQVGFVPATAGVRYEAKRRRGAARPFRALYGSRLGLAATTPTPPARI